MLPGCCLVNKGIFELLYPRNLKFRGYYVFGVDAIAAATLVFHVSVTQMFTSNSYLT